MPAVLAVTSLVALARYVRRWGLAPETKAKPVRHDHVAHVGGTGAWSVVGIERERERVRGPRGADQDIADSLLRTPLT